MISTTATESQMKKIIKEIKPTSRLSKSGEKIFYDILNKVVSPDPIDAYQLTILADAYDEFARLSEYIFNKENKDNEDPYSNQHGQYSVHALQKNKTVDTILKLGDRFGLNPKARGDKAAPKEEKPFNPLDQFKK